MSEQIVIAIITGLLGTGTLGVLREMWKDKKKAPIDAATAAVALSESAGQQALALVEQLQEEVQRLHAERKQDRAMITAVRNEFELFRDMWTIWYHKVLVAKWDVVRQQPIPPDPPSIEPGKLPPLDK